MDEIPEGVALVVDFFTVEIRALDVVDELVLIDDHYHNYRAKSLQVRCLYNVCKEKTKKTIDEEPRPKKLTITDRHSVR